MPRANERKLLSSVDEFVDESVCMENDEQTDIQEDLDLDQVRLSKVRREPRELKLPPEIEIETARELIAAGARGRDGLGSLAQ